MNLATKIKQNASDPRKWIGRKSSRCRKHGNATYYVNQFGQIGCVACDNPDESRVLLLLQAHDGIWYDQSDGFEAEVSQQATQELQPYDETLINGRPHQIMPVDDDGNLMTWYEYDRLHGKPKNMDYKSYVYFKWIMYGFDPRDESEIPEIRFGKSR